ncbi:MAG: carbohydrate ABC transporter permease, partial [Clostridia bacterium]
SAMKTDVTMEELTSAAQRAYMATTIKYALVFISSAPMLIAYPFVQKYFVKGIMIGAIKG